MTQEIGRGGSITLDAVYADGTGQTVDPTTPKVSIIDPTGTTVVTLADPVHDSLGHYHYVYPVAVGAQLGAWAARWYGIINGVQVGPIDDGFTVVAAGSISTPDDSIGLNPGPCDPWDADLCCDTTGVDQDLIDRMVMAATEVYWGLSGRQFGVCTIPAIRPCRRSCFDGSGWAQWSGGNPFASGWAPGGWQSGWWFPLTCGACPGDCSCTAVEEIALPSPVAEIVQVKIDGAVLAASAYRVDNWNTLVRTDGGVWPTCQSMSLDDTEAGTMSVTLKVGKQVPTLGELAVAELACVLIQGCRPEGECAVPSHLVAQTRAGNTQAFTAISELVQEGLVGLDVGDLFLRTFNPSRLHSRSSVHSPDYRPARRAGT